MSRRRCRMVSKPSGRTTCGVERDGIVDCRSILDELPAGPMAKASKLIATKRGKVLVVRRRVDGLWMFPGGRRRPKETDRECIKREIAEELPSLKLGRLSLWKEIKETNRKSGRKMNDAIFIAAGTKGRLVIGDKKEIDRAVWHKPHGIRLTPTSRFIRDRLFSKQLPAKGKI